MYDLVVRGGTVATPQKSWVTDVGIQDGKIACLGPDLRGKRILDAAGMLVLPGVLDCHVHLALPVRGDRSRDDFLSGTKAALAGGVTTVMDFTVGSPETDLLFDLDSRLETAKPALCDYSFHCEMVGWRPGKEKFISRVINRGVTSFKFFTAYGDSGRRSDSGALYRCFQEIARQGGLALVHAEDDDLIRALESELSEEEIARMDSLPRTRPDLCEGSAIDQVAYFAGVTGAHVHIVHTSSGLGASRVALWKSQGVSITAETCPQYLFLTDQVYSLPEGHLYSASPALRKNQDREILWKSLKDGVIDFVATDHCPFTRAQKTWKGSFKDLPYGLPCVELLLPLVYQGVLQGRITLQDMVKALCQNPADLYGLPGKGRMEIGFDGDLVLFDPSKSWVVRSEDLHMNVDFSPYEAMEIKGKVMKTLSRGEVVFDEGEILAEAGRGKFLPRKAMFRHI